MNTQNKIDLLAHEALDRTYIVMEMLADYLIDHAYFYDKNTKTEKLEKAFQLLHEVYQEIGNER